MPSKLGQQSTQSADIAVRPGQEKGPKQASEGSDGKGSTRFHNRFQSLAQLEVLVDVFLGKPVSIE